MSHRGGHDIGIPLEGIIGGEYDAYLKDFAKDVETYGQPVFIGLGWEMNGDGTRTVVLRTVAVKIRTPMACRTGLRDM